VVTSFAHLTAPAVITISFILSSNKMQNGDTVVPADAGPIEKMAIKMEREYQLVVQIPGYQTEVALSYNAQ